MLSDGWTSCTAGVLVGVPKHWQRRVNTEYFKYFGCCFTMFFTVSSGLCDGKSGGGLFLHRSAEDIVTSWATETSLALDTYMSYLQTEQTSKAYTYTSLHSWLANTSFGRRSKAWCSRHKGLSTDQ